MPFLKPVSAQWCVVLVWFMGGADWMLGAGVEYEALLCEKLRNVGIPFVSEDSLRSNGFFKTPDIKLQVILAILRLF